MVTVTVRVMVTVTVRVIVRVMVTVIVMVTVRVRVMVTVMKQTADLKTLLEKAKSVEKFKASSFSCGVFSSEKMLDVIGWHAHLIIADWEYELVKEPLKLEAESWWNVYESNKNIRFVAPSSISFVDLQKFIGKKTKITIEEIVE
jgi:hypothetical protein